MNTINENEVRLANLKAAAEMRRAEFEDIRAKVSDKMVKIIEDAIAASGVSGYALRKGENGELRDLEYMTLEGEIDGERLYDIDLLYFRDDSWSDDEDKPRVLSVSTCCFGVVKAGDKKGVAYCVLMGHLVTRLQEIQDALNAIPEWDAYNLALHTCRISLRDAEAFGRDLKEKAEAARLAEIEKRLVVGAVIATERVRRYNTEKRQSIYTGVVQKVVQKVTAKLIFFKDEYRQYKKADVLNLLAKGLEKNGWSFAKDVDISKYPCPVEG